MMQLRFMPQLWILVPGQRLTKIVALAAALVKLYAPHMRLQLFKNGTHIGVWQFDSKSENLYLNDQVLKLFSLLSLFVDYLSNAASSNKSIDVSATH